MEEREKIPASSAILMVEQFRALRRQVPILYAALAVNVLVLAVSAYGTVQEIFSIFVPVGFLALIVVRGTIWLLRRKLDPGTVDIPRQLRITTLTATGLSAALGAWGFALMYLTSEAEKPFVPLFVGFGSIACAYCLSSLPRAAILTILFGTVPVCGALLLSGGKGQIATAINLILNLTLVVRLISEQFWHFKETVAAHGQVRLLAYADPLTGLANRRSLYERLEAATQQYQTGGSGFSLAMIDLDGFKLINDTYGHPAGDKLLAEAALRIRAACAPAAIVARVGGDEFAILVPEAEVKVTEELGKRLKAALEQPFILDHSRFHLSASIGIATCPGHGWDGATILSRADVALYRVKSDGGRGVKTFRPEFEADMHRRTTIEQALRELETRPDIRVLFQPIFDTQSEKIITFEALARWNHPELGAIEPTEFIAAAERTDTVSRLSAQIFDTAIETAARWPSSIGLSLNLSAIQLRDPTTPLMIMLLLQKHDVAAERIELEVTETSVLTDIEASREMIEMLRSSGLRVVLDDFGAGYASIGYLKDIAFDHLKIDGEIISMIDQSLRARDLLAGILALCRTMHISATAEKVETPRQLETLKALGCDRVQGYLLGRPIDAAGTIEFQQQPDSFDRLAGRED